MIAYLILGMTYAFAAAVEPGPLQTYLISQTLSHGWRRTLPAAFSPLISDGPVIALVLGPLLLKAWRETSAHGVALLAGFYGVMVLSLAATIVLFAAARNLGPRVLIALSSVALACFGCYLLWSGDVAAGVFQSG